MLDSYTSHSYHTNGNNIQYNIIILWGEIQTEKKKNMFSIEQILNPTYNQLHSLKLRK